MLAAIMPNSAKPFNFQKEYGMTEEMVSCLLTANVFACARLPRCSVTVGMFITLQALRVSNHYPVEVELRKALPFWMAKNAQRHDNVDTHKASVNRAVTGKE